MLETTSRKTIGEENPQQFSHVLALDGIRGLAVAIVVIYHFAPNILPAGFIGVDVFFVLSGFLIASLALREHQSTSKFSSSGFYMRRARRLLPAAIVTVVGAVTLAAILQPDSVRAATRGQGIASLLYVANWWMIDQRNSYQAAFGTESPLSHFWSLAVEEQFYVVFPLILLAGIAITRRRRGTTAKFCRWLFVASIIGALASATLMAMEYNADSDPSRIYLGTDTRVHAIFVGVAGACIWWMWSSKLRERASRTILTTVAVISVVFLGLVCVFSNFRSPWLYRYGFLAISIAALAVILAGVANSKVISTVFRFRWICVLGLVSYSVYLWHWPVRVFVSQSNTPFEGISLFLVRVGLTAVAALLSYFLVERPFRSMNDGRRVALFSIVGIAVALCAVWVISRPVPAPATEFSTVSAPTEAPSTTPAIRMLLFGDSVAWNMGGGRLDFPHPIGYDSPFDSASVLLWNKADYGCPLVRYPQRSFDVVKQNTGWCVERETEWPPMFSQFNPEVVAWSSTLFDTYDYRVDGRWVAFGTPEWIEIYNSNLESARQLVVASGAKFMLLAQADPLADPTQSGDGQESLLPENIWRFAFVRDLQQKFAESHSEDTVFVDLQPIVCPNDSCRDVAIDPNGDRPDGVHFTSDAVIAMGPKIQAAIEKAMGR
jgi:peptidoglycan/LPS O-acetylase OafA/YrhL